MLTIVCEPCAKLLCGTYIVSHRCFMSHLCDRWQTCDHDCVMKSRGSPQFVGWGPGSRKEEDGKLASHRWLTQCSRGTSRLVCDVVSVSTRSHVENKPINLNQASAVSRSVRSTLTRRHRCIRRALGADSAARGRARTWSAPSSGGEVEEVERERETQ